MALSCGGYTLYHLLIFILTFFSYAFFHATRKTLSNVKSSISAEWTSDGFFPNASVWLLPNETWNRRHIFEGQTKADPFLGYLDTGFMLAYSLGLFYSGSLGDKFSLKKVLSFGMITSGIVVYFFGSFTEFKHYYYPSLYVVLIVLNGFCQSVGWPTVIAIMGNWFGKTSRGFILGLWSSCASVGNILGALITAAVLPNGYEYAFLLTSTLLFGLGVVNLFALIDSPSEIEEEVYEYYVERPDAEGGSNNTRGNDEQEPLLGDGVIQRRPVEKKEAISIFTAFALPGVLPCALSYACLKLVNYSFFFWLPLYMGRNWNLPESTADNLSIWYDIGGIIGGCIGGYISDRIGYRAVVVFPMMLISIPILYIFNVISHPHTWLIIVLLTVGGFFIGGASNLISSAISADLGQQRKLKKNKKALATVTGIIDGTGSFGAAVGQVGLPYIEVGYGWKWVFQMFIITCGITALFLLPIVHMEYKEWRYGIPENEDEDNEDKTSPATAPTPIDYSLPPPSYDEIS